jgi:hypothetical protein
MPLPTGTEVLPAFEPLEVSILEDMKARSATPQLPPEIEALLDYAIRWKEVNERLVAEWLKGKNTDWGVLTLAEHNLLDAIKKYQSLYRD